MLPEPLPFKQPAALLLLLSLLTLSTSDHATVALLDLHFLLAQCVRRAPLTSREHTP